MLFQLFQWYGTGPRYMVYFVFIFRSDIDQGNFSTLYATNQIFATNMLYLAVFPVNIFNKLFYVFYQILTQFLHGVKHAHDQWI